MDSGQRIDLTRQEDLTFWSWAAINTFYYTGMRLEELVELTSTALFTYRLPDTGEGRPDPAQRSRLEEIVTNLHERLAEARERGWIGEVEGIEVSIAAAQDKLARMRRIVSLGTPTTRPNGDPP
ncbi:hypothetical protein ACU686_12530 [Yinghuangia aomiensis]